MKAPDRATEATSPIALSARPTREHVIARLAGGGAVALRPLRRGETGPLQAIFDAMSPSARAQRYLTGMPRLPAPWLETLADVDGERHVAWLASVGTRPVGVARYVVVAPGVVEIAMEVADAYQGLGIGTVLVDALTTAATARGIRRIRATLLPENEPSRRLVTRLGVRLTVAEGLLEGEGALRLLDPPRVDRHAVVALAARQSGSDHKSLG
ncbi:GNAT family N-acetyltransferase [Nocardioides sp.]|uniref:GNAT family N-acetyltransferase n=1 Tax=Nocardioides sp. TaxID=35761 RepID=UPI002ED2EB8B